MTLKKYDDEKNRIKYHYEIGTNKPNFGKIIDNTKQNPEETAELIFVVFDYSSPFFSFSGNILIEMMAVLIFFFTFDV